MFTKYCLECGAELKLQEREVDKYFSVEEHWECPECKSKFQSNYELIADESTVVLREKKRV